MRAIILVTWAVLSFLGWLCDSITPEDIYLATSVILAAQYVAKQNNNSNENL